MSHPPGRPRKPRLLDQVAISTGSGVERMSILTDTRRYPALTLVALLALGVPLLPAPVADRQWHGIRTAGFEGGAALLLVFLVAQAWNTDRRRAWTQAFHATPLRFLVAFVSWSCLSALLAPAKPFALQGLLQLGAGVLITVTIAAEARTRPQYEFLLNALTATTLLVALSGFALFGQGSDQLGVGLYHDHQLYGAVFTILLPLVFALSLSPGLASRRLLAQAALIGGGVALGLSETRASWIGVAVAGLVLLGLFLWAQTFTPRSIRSFGSRQWRQFLLPTMAVAGTLTYLLIATPQTRHIIVRMRTLITTVSRGKEDSVKWRLLAWKGARRMIWLKPGLGWGIGCYPYYQHEFTRQGDDDAQVMAHGPTIPDETHDSYLQITTEMGLPGLFLWLGVLISMFALGVPALRRLTPGGLRQRALIGCLSALTGQAVDAIANPGWQFGEVSIFLWIVLGLTVTLSLGVPPVAAEDNRDLKIRQLPPIGLQVSKSVFALAVSAGLIWTILHTMSVLPAPTL